MNRADEAMCEVPYSCDYIDEILNNLGIRVGEPIDQGRVQDIEWDLDSVRQVNSMLRGYVEKYGNDADMFEGMVHRLEALLVTKDEQIMSLEGEVQKLQRELSDVERNSPINWLAWGR